MADHVAWLAKVGGDTHEIGCGGAQGLDVSHAHVVTGEDPSGELCRGINRGEWLRVSSCGDQHRGDFRVPASRGIVQRCATTEDRGITASVRVGAAVEKQPGPGREPATRRVMQEFGDERRGWVELVTESAVPRAAFVMSEPSCVEEFEPIGVIAGLGVPDACVVDGLAVVRVGPGVEQ